MAITLASEANAILQFVILITWKCLTDTPLKRKHTLFARFITSLSVLQGIATTASLTFAPGLLEVLQAAAPPTIEFFKRLPTDASSRWGIYTIVLEKPECRPKLYIGSGTSKMRGVSGRLRAYEVGDSLPRYVKHALDDDYVIVYKGLLCWISLPTPALQPVSRLLMLALEASFAYMVWAMRTRTRDYGMSHVCLWDRSTLEWDGLCSHCSLNEGVCGDFDLSAEELEAQAVDKEEKRLAMKADNSTNYHYKQMAENYDEYVGRLEARRVNNQGRVTKLQALNTKKAVATKKFYCKLCDKAVGSSSSLRLHKKSAKHIRNARGAAIPFRCAPCNLDFNYQSDLSRHKKSARHQKKIAPDPSQAHGGASPFRCAPCKLDIHYQSELKRHNESPRHQKKIAADPSQAHGGVSPFRCAPCNFDFDWQSDFNKHNKTPRHQKKIAANPSLELE